MAGDKPSNSNIKGNAIYDYEGTQKVIYEEISNITFASGAALKTTTPVSDVKDNGLVYSQSADPRSTNKADLKNEESVWYNTSNGKYYIYKDFEWYAWQRATTSSDIANLLFYRSMSAKYDGYAYSYSNTWATVGNASNVGNNQIYALPCFSIQIH